VFFDQSPKSIFRTLEYLREKGYNIKFAEHEASVTEAMLNEDVFAVLVNLNGSSIDFLSQIAGMTGRPFIVVYSVAQEDYVQQVILDTGVEAFVDFIHRPIVTALFLRNLQRRMPAQQLEGFVLDEDGQAVVAHGVRVSLPRLEFRLLRLLFGSPGQFFTREDIAVALWADPGVARKRRIDVHVCHIRSLAGKELIEFRKGSGYRVLTNAAGIVGQPGT
jgi:DNA-binding response OmpR family regulator